MACRSESVNVALLLAVDLSLNPAYEAEVTTKDAPLLFLVFAHQYVDTEYDALASGRTIDFSRSKMSVIQRKTTPWIPPIALLSLASAPAISDGI